MILSETKMLPSKLLKYFLSNGSKINFYPLLTNDLKLSQYLGKLCIPH